MQDVLSKLCSAWPMRSDGYASPGCWVEHTLSDPSLPADMSPFALLFGRKPRTTTDALVGRHRQIRREIWQALEKRHRDRVESRQAANVRILRLSAGTATKSGDLLLVKEADSSVH